MLGRPAKTPAGRPVRERSDRRFCCHDHAIWSVEEFSKLCKITPSKDRMTSLVMRFTTAKSVNLSLPYNCQSHQNGEIRDFPRTLPQFRALSEKLAHWMHYRFNQTSNDLRPTRNDACSVSLQRRLIAEVWYPFVSDQNQSESDLFLRGNEHDDCRL